MVQAASGAGRGWFRPARAATVALLFAVPILSGLGLWQVSRGQDKAALIVAAAAAQALPPSRFDPAAAPVSGYRRVQVTGRFLADREGLLDNQLRDGQVGYDVLTPLRVDGLPGALIVDRGWLARGGRRSDLASWQTPAGEVTLIGYLRLPTDIPFVTGAVSETFGTRWVVAEISPVELEKYLGLVVAAQVLRLAPESEHGFRRDWPLTTMTPARHYAYAAQWFGLAAALCVMYGLAGWRRARALPQED